MGIPENRIKCKVYLFGAFELWKAEKRLENWPQPKTQMLFKILASARGHPFTQDRLIEMLFPDQEPRKALNNLYRRISELRYLLEPTLSRGIDSRYVLRSGEGSYSLHPEAPCWIDLEEFTRLTEATQKAVHARRWNEARQKGEQAVALWRGDFLAENLYEEWTLSLREHFHTLYLETLVHLGESCARLGDYDRAIAHCAHAAALEPAYENAYLQLMLYHYLKGESNQALQLYERYIQELQQRFGLAPSGKMQELSEQIQKDHVPTHGFPPVLVRYRVPAPATSFIGRSAELTELKYLLQSHRLVTLTGAGGVGKTRLAAHLAQTLLSHFVDGVWFIELESLNDAALVPYRVISVLELPEDSQNEPLETLSRYLAHKELFLILDNCEHVIEACARLVAQALGASPKLRVLCTSREILGISGEKIYRVPPLSVPDATTPLERNLSSEALQLFLERAREKQTSFRLTEKNFPAVTQICQRLDGLPLAIELAAAKVSVLSPAEIAQRLEDRFRLLTGGSRTAMARQQRLHATVEWSYELLSEKERLLFSRLAVFAGSFTAEAAEAICTSVSTPFLEKSEILDLLTALVNKSLVLSEEHGERKYFRMLETIRQYSQEKLLHDATLLHQRHRDWYLTWAEGIKLQKRYDQYSRANSLEIAHDNLRKALIWSLDQNESAAALRTAVALGSFWELRGYFYEGREWLRQILTTEANHPAPFRLRAQALIIAGQLAWRQGDYQTAENLGKEALALVGHCPTDHHCKREHNCHATATYLLGLCAHYQGEYQRARALYDESALIYRALGDRAGLADVLTQKGRIAYFCGEYKRATEQLREALIFYRELEDQHGIASALLLLGEVAIPKEETTQARTLLEEALQIYRELGDQSGIVLGTNLLGALAYYENADQGAVTALEQGFGLSRKLGDRRGMALARCYQGALAGRRGDLASAAEMLRESFTLRTELNDRRGMMDSLYRLAMLAFSQDRWESVARLLGAADTLRAELSIPWPPYEEREHQQLLIQIQTKLGKRRFSQLHNNGKKTLKNGRYTELKEVMQ